MAANAEEGGVLTPKQTLIGDSAGTCEAVGIRTPGAVQSVAPGTRETNLFRGYACGYGRNTE